MKRALIYFFMILLFFIMAVFFVKAYEYFAPPEERNVYQIAQSDDTLRIAYIGDSWAYIHNREHQCLIPEIINNQCQKTAKIYSYGFPGRTSREIYEAFFNDEKQMQILQSTGFQYCIISAGINDANKKMSIKYYQNSMDYIIRFLLSNHVRPIIIEMPDYDIKKTYRWQRTDRKLRYRLSMIINKIPLDCKQIYRDALDDLINERDYQEKVSIIRYKSWNNNYEKDQTALYLIDGIHLNDYGNAVLDSVIAKEIIKTEKHDYRN